MISINQRFSRAMGRGNIFLRKNSPEILLGLGIIGGVTAAIWALKNHRKGLDIIENTIMEKHDIEADNHLETEDGEGDQGKLNEELGRLYIGSGVALAKIYGPPIGLGITSIVLILASHGIMKRREVALYATLKLFQDAFVAYRQRVVEELGPDADRDFYLGLHDKTKYEYVTDEEGKRTRITKKFKDYDPNFKSVYARFFDNSSAQWLDSHEDNMMFLRNQQQWANDKLRANGHIFLNEVYDMLGIPRTTAGQIVGWIANPKPDEGDKFVDFDLLNPYNAPGRDFINGYNTQGILLDFNVQGVVYHLI